METIKVSLLKKQRGITLIEVMITFVITSILISITVPSLITMTLNSRLSALHNSLISDLALARNTSVTSGNFVILCASNSSQTNCRTNSSTWTFGWLIFTDVNDNGSVSAGEPILQVSNRPEHNLKLISNIAKVKFSPEGSAIGYANVFTFCDDRGDSAKKGLKLSNSGSAQIADTDEITRACP